MGESRARLEESKLQGLFPKGVLKLRARGAIFMAKRRGNPNWGKPEPIGPITPTITEFEQVVREYKLSPDQYLRSTRLREWARRNKNSKYIPEPLLEAWGFEIESTL
jgi:predicted metal-binding protein